jgi:hypothetical protein
VPVVLRVLEGRFAPAAEAAIYFTVAEALTNVAKHSHAALVSVQVEVEGGEIIARVADDGVGGVRVTAGSGLTGLHDRLDAIGGTLTVENPPAAERPSVLGSRAVTRPAGKDATMTIRIAEPTEDRDRRRGHDRARSGHGHPVSMWGRHRGHPALPSGERVRWPRLPQVRSPWKTRSESGASQDLDGAFHVPKRSETLIGNLLMPAPEELAGVVIAVGPLTSVKEQAAGTRLRRTRRRLVAEVQAAAAVQRRRLRSRPRGSAHPVSTGSGASGAGLS